MRVCLREMNYKNNPFGSYLSSKYVDPSKSGLDSESIPTKETTISFFLAEWWTADKKR